MEDGKCKLSFEGLKPTLGMVLVQIVLAGVNIFYKLALNDGMDVKILVAYRYIASAAFLCPLALFLERKKRPTLTWTVLFQAFCCGLFGGTLSQNMYVESMKLTSATFATAINNLTPAITFILAVLFRLEKLGIQTTAGQVKIAGTVTGLGGAMILTFYKGPQINLWSTNINLLGHGHGHGHGQGTGTGTHGASDTMAGSTLAIASCFCIAIWMIVQAKMSHSYPCHHSSSALMCLMGAIQATIYALLFNRDMSRWRLGFDIRLLTITYSGVVGSVLIFSVMAWCIQQRGPLFASVFNPLLLVLVAILGSFILNELLHLGSIIGTILIVIGLYMVLWGKGREAKARAAESTKDPTESSRDPLEILVAVDGMTISRDASSARINVVESVVNELEFAPIEKQV